MHDEHESAVGGGAEAIRDVVEAVAEHLLQVFAMQRELQKQRSLYSRIC